MMSPHVLSDRAHRRMCVWVSGFGDPALASYSCSSHFSVLLVSLLKVSSRDDIMYDIRSGYLAL